MVYSKNPLQNTVVKVDSLNIIGILNDYELMCHITQYRYKQ